MTAPAARHDDNGLAELHELRSDSERARAALRAERLALCELLSDGPELSAAEHRAGASFRGGWEMGKFSEESAS